MFGSSLEQSKAGIAIGQPMFTVAQRTTSGFILGRFDYLPSDGFSNGVANPNEPAQFTSNGVSCPAPTVVGDYCGKFEQSCSPEVDLNGDAVDQSFTATFEYCGGAATGDFSLGSAGWFTRNYTLYSDTECTVGTEKVSYTETGTLNTGQEVASAGEQANYFQRWAPATTVTAYAPYITTISLNCPCGGAWEAGVPRRLTQCVTADGTGPSCVNPGWYQNVSLGQVSYGAVRRLSDTIDKDELQFSTPFGSSQVGNAVYLDGLGGLAYQNTDSTCAFNTPSYDVCGTWTRDCSAETFAADATTMLLMTGEGDDDGQMLMYKQYFDQGAGCDENLVQLSIEAKGYYSKLMVEDTHPGVLVGYTTTKVTATNEGSMVDTLNDVQNGCPCGGTWVDGVTRTLTTCPSGTCPGAQIFGAGTLGTPGYGLIVITGGMLQMSDLQPTIAAGIYPNGKFAVDDFPFTLDAACEAPIPTTTVCGNWSQPCNSDGIVTDFEINFYYETVDGKNSYTMDRTDYAPGTGCDTTPILTVTQSGTLIKTGAQTAVANGIAVNIQPATMTITPLTDDVVTRLAGVCACGITWTVNVPQTFTGACPAGTCTDVSWLRQPIGVSVYGSMQHKGEALRITEMSADMTEGYQNDLQVYDYSLDQTDADACAPAPPSPRPGKGGKKGGMKGGSVFVLLLFLGIAFYFIGGMVMNHQRTGTPSIPHVEFWRSIPTLIGSGLKFLLSGCKKDKGNYSDFGGNPDNSYGSL